MLTYTWPLVRLEGVSRVTPAYWAILCVITGVLAASIAMVTSYCSSMQPKDMKSEPHLKLWTVHTWLSGCVEVPFASCCWTRTDAASLVPGQLEPWATLTGHAPFGCLFADVGAAMLLIHTVEALWDRKRVRAGQWNSPTVTDQLHTKAHILRD